MLIFDCKFEIERNIVNEILEFGECFKFKWVLELGYILFFLWFNDVIFYSYFGIVYNYGSYFDVDCVY